MKKISMSILAGVLITIAPCTDLFSQDTLFRLNEKAIVCEVIKENGSDITYKQLEGKRLIEKTISKSGIFLIKPSALKPYYPVKSTGEIDLEAFEKQENGRKELRREKLITLYNLQNPVTDTTPLGKAAEKRKTKRLKKKTNRFIKANWYSIPDTLVLIDRAGLNVAYLRDFQEDSTGYLAYREVDELKVKIIERDKVFSVKSPGKEDEVVYVQDTLENNWLTAAQMKDYISGQTDARNHYARRANWTAAGGFLTGGIGAGAGLFYGPLFIIGYTGLAGFSKPSFTARNGYNPGFENNEYYREGFGTMAKRMVTRRSAIAASVGYVVGVVGLSVLLQ